MFSKSRMVRVTTILSCLFLAATFFLPAWRLMPLAESTPFIALHYNIYLGVDKFGAIERIFTLPFLGLFFLLLNLVVQARTWKHQKTLSLFYAAANPMFQFVLLVAMVLIVLINL